METLEWFIRAAVWLAVALAIAGAANGNPWTTIAAAPIIGGLGILGAFVMSLLLSPRNE